MIISLLTSDAFQPRHPAREESAMNRRELLRRAMFGGSALALGC